MISGSDPHEGARFALLNARGESIAYCDTVEEGKILLQEARAIRGRAAKGYRTVEVEQ